MRVTNERLRDVAEFRVIPEDIGEAERMMLALDLIDARAGAASVAEDVRVVLGAFEAGIFCRSTSGDGDPHWVMQFVKPIAALASLQRAVTHDAASVEGGERV